MRRCPSCQTVYTDPEQRFCLNDGAQLIEDNAGNFDPQATLVASGPPSNPMQPRPTQTSWPGQQPQSAPHWSAPPPPQYGAPQPRKKSKLPWILGGLVVAVVGMGILGVVGLFILGAYVGSNNSNQTANRSTRYSNQSSSNSRLPVNSSSTNTSGVSGNGSTAPGDEDAILEQLTRVENEWNQANFQADRDALKRILADEYSGIAADGTAQDKDKYLSTLQPAPDVKSWELQNLKVSWNGETAILEGVLVLKRTGGKEKYNFTDTFIWRDGRWQAVGSYAAPMS